MPLILTFSGPLPVYESAIEVLACLCRLPRHALALGIGLGLFIGKKADVMLAVGVCLMVVLAKLPTGASLI